MEQTASERRRCRPTAHEADNRRVRAAARRVVWRLRDHERTFDRLCAKAFAPRHVVIAAQMFAADRQRGACFELCWIAVCRDRARRPSGALLILLRAT